MTPAIERVNSDSRSVVNIYGSGPIMDCTASATHDKASKERLFAPILSVQEVRSSSRSRSKRKKTSKHVNRSASTTIIRAEPSTEHDQDEFAQQMMTTSPTAQPQCPVLASEFQNIQARHKTLASTGCTAQFCQAGRMLHTDEPRVGENRALKVVEQEAKDFLEDLHIEGFYDSNEAFCERLRIAFREIRAGAINGIVRVDKKQGRIGGNWTQTPAELEFGLRRAWRNSRKCIMRSHCEELK